MLVVAAACSPVRKLPNSQKLLVGQQITVDNKALSAEEVEGLMLQKPNQRFLGIWHLNLWVYQRTGKGDLTRFKKWLRRSAGRPPAIFNESEVEQSRAIVQSWLASKGYFHASVSPSVVTKGKSVELNWDIVTGKPYQIRNYKVTSEDSLLGALVKGEVGKGLVKRGDRYDVAALQAERERITLFLRNEGYFAFSADYILFEIDSSLRSNQLDVFMTIRNPRRLVGFADNKELFGIDRHKKYHIGRVFVHPQYSTLRSIQGGTRSDTLHWYLQDDPTDTLGLNRLTFVYDEKPRIRFSTLIESITIRPGDRYNLRHAENTYLALSALPIYRSVNINYTPSSQVAPGADSLTTGLLDCSIQMSKNNVMAFSVEADGTNSGGDLGISGNINFLNRNIFRGGEVLNLKLRTALEMQQSLGDPEQNKILLFNTIEAGAEASILFPRFVAPFRSNSLPRHLRPQTSLNSGFNLQYRPDYRRYITNVGFGYRWRPNPRITHFLSPLEINSVRIFPSAEFEAKLAEITNERLRNQYTNHLITSLKYSFVYNNQQVGRVHDHYFFRADFESAGNALYAIDNLLGAPRNSSGYYTLFNIRYAQYLRTSLDFRYFRMFDQNNTLAVRGLVGVGKPYGNADVLPFEKGFFAGGANGMRGWNLKNLGPGSFADPEGKYPERMGDLQLEGNIEFRFPMYGFLKGGLFVDVGNIWLLSDIPTYTGGKFDPATFVSELALDAGLGFRFDFDFFVFRVDAALPLRDPSKPLTERWVVSKSRPGDVLWNFGIGYPF
ncbi:MAG: BamA/TamA family outer membrane protein [Bacteroidales bacterium]|nr:BamA/TamA family outer membrane protein [Bacteroidales bacterium]